MKSSVTTRGSDHEIGLCLEYDYRACRTAATGLDLRLLRRLSTLATETTRPPDDVLPHWRSSEMIALVEAGLSQAKELATVRLADIRRVSIHQHVTLPRPVVAPRHADTSIGF